MKKLLLHQDKSWLLGCSCERKDLCLAEGGHWARLGRDIICFSNILLYIHYIILRINLPVVAERKNARITTKYRSFPHLMVSLLLIESRLWLTFNHRLVSGSFSVLLIAFKIHRHTGYGWEYFWAGLAWQSLSSFTMNFKVDRSFLCQYTESGRCHEGWLDVSVSWKVCGMLWVEDEG